MPSRIIKESIWTSPNLNALNPLAERYFYRLLPFPDDHGCFEATPLVVKGRCFPLRPEIRVKDIEDWNSELEQHGLVKFWSEGDRLYGLFTSWSKHQRVRSLHQRKTPTPPDDDNAWRQLPSDDGLYLNPNPNLNLKKKCAFDNARHFLSAKKRKLFGEKLEWFEQFWDAFDFKKGKAGAADSWLDIQGLDEALFQKILAGAEREARQRQLITKDGRTPKWAQGWITERRWEDEQVIMPSPGVEYDPELEKVRKDLREKGLLQ